MCKTTKGDDVKKYGSNRKGGIRLIHGIYFLNTVTSNKSGPYPKFLPVVIFFWFLFHAHLLKFWIFLWFSMILFYADFLQFYPFTINVLLTFWTSSIFLANTWHSRHVVLMTQRRTCWWICIYICIRQNVSISGKFKVKLIVELLSYQVDINLLKVTMHLVTRVSWLKGLHVLELSIKRMVKQWFNIPSITILSYKERILK